MVVVTARLRGAATRPNPQTAHRYTEVLGVDVEIVCSNFTDFDPARL
jgi:hypothetical protein